MDDLIRSFHVAGSGMRAQGERVRVVAENLANAQSTADTAGGDPYRRKTVTFRNEMDRALGVGTVRVDRIGVDRSPFKSEYDPTHPSAGPDGYVKLPNVNTLIEVMDMREAQRSYEANLGMIETARSMIQRTLELLRS